MLRRRDWASAVSAATLSVAATALMIVGPGAPAAASAAGAEPPMYREGPPVGHTGGFGEPTCAECHFGGPVNPERGSLKAELPGTFESGRTYWIDVALAHPDMGAAGFQLAVRFVDGPRGGEQAGTLRSVGPRTTVTTDTVTGVQYAHQTTDGATLSGQGATRWVLEWTAPQSAADVVVHIAANAANDDASEFGDVVFVRDARIAGTAADASSRPSSPAAPTAAPRSAR